MATSDLYPLPVRGTRVVVGVYYIHVSALVAHPRRGDVGTRGMFEQRVADDTHDDQRLGDYHDGRSNHDHDHDHPNADDNDRTITVDNGDRDAGRLQRHADPQ